MGSNKTDTSQPLCGFVIPYEMAVTGTLGTDHTEASTEAEGFEPSGSTTVALTAEGELSTTDSLTLSCAKSGSLDPLGGGFAYKLGSGDWIGAEAPWLVTNYRGTPLFAESSTGARDPLDVAALTDSTGQRDGRILIATITDADEVPAVAFVGADGTMGAAAEPFGSRTARGIAVTAGAAGDAYAYIFRLVLSYQTSNTYNVETWRHDGSSWTLQARDALPESLVVGADVRRMVAARAPGGGTLLLITSDTGTSSEVRQYRSSDGIRFAQVGDTIARMTAWSAWYGAGAFHIATTEDLDDDTDDEHVYRRITTAGQSLATSYAVAVTDTVEAHSDPAAVVADYDGALYFLRNDGDGLIEGFRSIDRGATWLTEATGPAIPNSDGSQAPDCLAVAWRDRTLLVYATATSGRDIVELSFGGDGDVTEAPIVDYVLQAWAPFDGLRDSGYTAVADSGSPTRTESVKLGELTTTGAGVTANMVRQIGTNNDDAAACLAVVNVTSGTAQIVCENAKYRFLTDVTTTGIRVYESGDTPPTETAWTPGSTYAWVLVMVKSGATQGSARVFYGDADAYPVATSILTATHTGAGSRNSYQGIIIPESSSALVKLLRHSRATSYPALDESTPLGATDLNGIMLAATPRHLSSGYLATLQRGTPRIDGVTHTASPGGPYALRNVLPYRRPSPAEGWRSSGTAATTLKFRLTYADRAPLVGFYVDGLQGVATLAITIKDSGGSSVFTGSPTTLGESLTYDSHGANSVSGAASGSTTLGRWYRADELVGGQFECADGTLREIVGNTEGSLTSGSTRAEHRAVLYLDGAHDAATGGSGKVYPPRYVQVLQVEGEVYDIEVALTAISGAADMRCSVMAIGRFHALPRTPDLDDLHVTQSGSGIQTLEDGRRYSARRMNDRRRKEIAWVGSAHEVRQVINGTVAAVSAFARGGSSADYVQEPNAGEPSGDRWGLTYTLEGIVGRAMGRTVVWVDAFQLSDGDFIAAGAMPIDVLYGRIVNDYRREGMRLVGTRGRTPLYRQPALVIEEEL